MTRISIITVCYNSEATIRRTIESVAAQSYGNIEYIVIDGGSGDKTNEILEQYRGTISSYISERDDGLYDAMNKGWKLASGDVIGFLNSDDVLAHKDSIARIAAEFTRPEIDAVYGDLELVDSRGRVVRKWRSGEYGRFKYQFGWMTPHPATYLRRGLFEKYGGFRQDLSIAADYELMLRFFYRHRSRVHYLPHILVRMLTGGASTASLLTVVKANWQVYRAWQLNGLHTLPTIMILKPLSKLAQLRFGG